MQEFVGLINNVGFPIACVIYMAWSQSKQLTAFSDTIDRNTRVIERLTYKLDMEDVVEEED